MDEDAEYWATSPDDEKLKPDQNVGKQPTKMCLQDCFYFILFFVREQAWGGNGPEL